MLRGRAYLLDLCIVGGGCLGWVWRACYSLRISADPYGRLQRTTCLDQRCQIRPLHVCQKHVEWGLGHAYNFWIKLEN